jgi:TldD protein
MPTSLTQQFDISESRLKDIVADAVHGDDGELFLEYSEGEALMFDNGRLKTANFNTSQGFGLRAVAGEATGYAHSSEMTEQALLRASDAVSTVKDGYAGTMSAAPQRTNTHLYGEENPIPSPGFEAKAKLLQEIDGWVRKGSACAASDGVARIVVATCRDLARRRGIWCAISARWCGSMCRWWSAAAIGRKAGRMASEAASFGEFLTEDRWQFVAGEALQALVNLEAVPAPAGTSTSCCRPAGRA